MYQNLRSPLHQKQEIFNTGKCLKTAPLRYLFHPFLTLILPYWLSSRLLIATLRALSMNLRYSLLAFFLSYPDS
jgi:hypothetical protein